MESQNTPISLYSRVLMELVDSSSEAEQRESMLVIARHIEIFIGAIDSGEGKE